jgi:TPR repeat protein
LFEAAKYFKLAADQNHAVGQFNYGYCLSNGKGVEVDFVEAAKYYKLAADQKHAIAQFNYGYSLFHGEGVEVDFVGAARYYKLAADQNHAVAQFNYGYCLLHGKGVGVDFIEAAKYFKLAADQNHAAAQYNYGYCLSTGEGIGIDFVSAAKYFKMAADQNHAAAQFNYGYCLFHGEGVGVDFVLAAKYFKLAADQNHVVAQFNYGYCLSKGKGVQIDLVSAAKYYKLAADHNHAVAQDFYGVLLWNGEGVRADLGQAVKYFHLSADQKISRSQYNYAFCLEHHISIPLDLIQAVKYYELAADQGFPPAENRLGICLMFGRGIAANSEFAARRWESSADHGDSDGSNHFGLCLEFGQGVKPDLPRAAHYYQKAANCGHAEAEYHFGFCLEHGLGVNINLSEAARYYKLSGDHGHIGGLRSYARFLHYGIGGNEDLLGAAQYYELSVKKSGHSIEDHHFRCLRSQNHGSFCDVQFSDLSSVRLKVFSECQSARPVRSGMLCDFVAPRSCCTATTILGHGSSSTVVLVKDPNCMRTFAIKHFHANVYQTEFIKEFEILVKLNHPCILQIYGFVPPSATDQAELHMEWASNGSLAQVMKLVHGPRRPFFWNPTGISIIICGIVFGMRFMHSRGFIHQDLKPSNILLDDKGRVLIGDFGASRSESVDVTPIGAGTVKYAAPEMFEENSDLTRKVDVYSFGLIMYELLVGYGVFSDDEPPFAIIRKKRSGYIPSMRREIFFGMRCLIETCLQLNPEDRPSFEDILAKFDANDFELVGGADGETVSEYVMGIRDWESSHPCRLSVVDPDYLSVGAMEPRQILERWV